MTNGFALFALSFFAFVVGFVLAFQKISTSARTLQLIYDATDEAGGGSVPPVNVDEFDELFEFDSNSGHDREMIRKYMAVGVHRAVQYRVAPPSWGANEIDDLIPWSFQWWGQACFMVLLGRMMRY